MENTIIPRPEVMSIACQIEEILRHEEECHSRYGYHSTEIKDVSVAIWAINPKMFRFPETNKDGLIKDTSKQIWHAGAVTVVRNIGAAKGRGMT